MTIWDCMEQTYAVAVAQCLFDAYTERSAFGIGLRSQINVLHVQQVQTWKKAGVKCLYVVHAWRWQSKQVVNAIQGAITDPLHSNRKGIRKRLSLSDPLGAADRCCQQT